MPKTDLTSTTPTLWERLTSKLAEATTSALSLRLCGCLRADTLGHREADGFTVAPDVDCRRCGGRGVTGGRA